MQKRVSKAGCILPGLQIYSRSPFKAGLHDLYHLGLGSEVTVVSDETSTNMLHTCTRNLCAVYYERMRVPRDDYMRNAGFETEQQVGYIIPQKLLLGSLEYLNTA